MESERAGLSPYDYCSNNPINKSDPSGMIDGWVDTGDGNGKVEYNSNIHSQEAATAVYGSNAQYYGESHDSYKGTNGSTYELFADGSFLKDNKSFIATDRASFTDHYFITRAGLGGGIFSGISSLMGLGQANAQTLALSTTTGYAQMGALMGDQNMSDAYEMLSGTTPVYSHHGNGDWAKSYGSTSSGGLNRTQSRLLNDMKSWDSYQWSFKTGEFATTTAASYGIGKLFAPMGAGRPVTSITNENIIGSGALSKPQYINLASQQRTTHIIAGDATGGGHAWFGSTKSFFNGVTGKKSMFPMNWSKEKIMHASSDVLVNYPSIQQTGLAGSLQTRSGQLSRFVTTGEYEGLKIKVVYNNADIVTAHPIGNHWISKFFHFKK